jgi:hypothetical protein
MVLGKKQGIVILGLVYVLALAFFLPKNDQSNDSYDHATFHMPTIRLIAEHFPLVDLKNDTQSAVSPGYNYFLAGMMVLTGSGEIGLRIFHCLVSFCLPAYLYYQATKIVSARDAILLALPLLLSPYFLKASAWIVTDNPALLVMSLTLAGCLRLQSNSQFWISPLLTALAVWIRQMYAWLVIPVSLAYILNNTEKTTLHKVKGVFFVCLPSLLILAWLVHAWGGLVPPAWREGAQAFSFASTLYAVSLMIFTFGPVVFIDGSTKKPDDYIWLAIAGLIGVLMAVMIRSDYSMEQGRWGGLFWTMAERGPAFYGRPLIFLILAPLGCLILMRIFLISVRASSKESLVLFCGMACWLTSFLPNRQIFHRYFEPALFIFGIFIFLIILKKRNPSQGLKNWRLAQAVMALVQVASLTILLIRYYF